MLRFYIYLIIAAGGILVTLIGNFNTEVVFAMTIVYFVSTCALTFRLVNLNEEVDTNPAEKPTYFYERQTGFNSENYARSALLIISAVLLVPSGNYWWILLIILWSCACLTILIPLYLGRNVQGWDIICEAISIEFQFKIPPHIILNVNNKLKKIDPKEIEIDDIVIPELTESEKKIYLNLYLKILRETTV